MYRSSIDPAIVYSGRFINMRAEAQLLYFFLAVSADASGHSDIITACNMTGTDYIEVKILSDKSLIEIPGDGSSTVTVNGLKHTEC